MTVIPEQVGQPSSIFGDKFPYPFDGKSILYHIARQFALEFNTKAKEYREAHGIDPVIQAESGQWTDLTVSSAYPTSKQKCPRLVVKRLRSTATPAGLGQEIETKPFKDPDTGLEWYSFRGEVIEEQLELTFCSANERLRDDCYYWIQQYYLDAIAHNLSRLASIGGIYELRCTSAEDDEVEYQGTQGQPGFEFYMARFLFTSRYDLMVVNSVDRLTDIVNWQQVVDLPQP